MTAKGKLIRNAVIAVVALALLSVGYYMVLHWNPEKATDVTTDPVYDDAIVLLDVPADNIQSIKLKTADAEYSLAQNTDGTISVPEYTGLNFRQIKLKTALSGFGRITAERKITDDLSRMEEFGVHRGDAFIAINQKDGTTQRLLIGDLLPDQSSYYCMVEKGDGIYILDQKKAEALHQGLESYRERTLLALEDGDIEKLSIQQNGALLLGVRPIEAGEKPQNSLAPDWIMEAPCSGFGGSNERVGEMLQSFLQIEISEFVDDNPKDLEQYGLGKNAHTVTIVAKDGEKHSLKVGKVGEKGAYIQWDGAPSVYCSTGAFGEVIATLDPMMYVEKFMRIAAIDDLAEIIVKKEGKSCTMAIGEGEEDDPEKFKVNGTPRSKSTFKKLFQQVIGVLFTDVADGFTPKGEPFMTVSYLYKDGSRDTIQYYECSERDYAARRSDGVVLTVLKNTMEPLFQEVEEDLK